MYYTVPLSIVEKITVTQYYSINGSLNTPLLTEQLELNNDVATSRAKKRWYLAYTLLRNPELIELRRNHKLEDKDIDDNKDHTKGFGQCNPVYVDDGGEFGIALEKDDATKL